MTNEEALEIVKDIHKSTWLKSYRDATKMAMEALEKQIPKQVIDCICPSCHSDIDGCGFICWNCGQHLDWGERWRDTLMQKK